jgi:hypothetical protein
MIIPSFLSGEDRSQGRGAGSENHDSNCDRRGGAQQRDRSEAERKASVRTLTKFTEERPGKQLTD